MDGKRFDNLARGIASTSGSRRRFLAGGLAAAAAAIGFGGQASAATKRAAGQICRKNSDCASSICLPRDATGRRYCGCTSAIECGITAACTTFTCEAGICTTGTPVICTPQDQCHIAGICNTSTGLCPADTLAAHGTPCTDGNPLCINGSCCTTDHAAINGGCFSTYSDGFCQGCLNNCAGSFDGTGLYACYCDKTTSCTSNADCAAGSACNLDFNQCFTAC